MPVNYFGVRFRTYVFGKSNNIKYKKCGSRPTNYDDQKCVGCVCVEKCSPKSSSQNVLQAKTHRIYNVSRIHSSEFTMNLAAFVVNTGSRDEQGNTWNQSSDRFNKHVNTNPVPSRASSTRGTITRLRPGALKPGGHGVDIKHNSYARFLNRRKAIAMLAGPYVAHDVNSNAVINNKVQKLNSVNCSY